MSEEEDSSVTAAVINVVCELGWRRPRDFLPLAPRLFELLVDGGNNWMAIKIIKLVSRGCTEANLKLKLDVVCNIDSARAALDQKTASAVSYVNSHNTCDVSSL